jgi:4-diphosphocytidyl-2-C-methyl-D-erythritol kinase
MGDASAVVLEAFAPAKVNLSLRVIARRPDGYHELVSLVTFASVGDRLTLTPGPALTLDVVGPTAAVAGAGADNLVLMAARSLAERVATLRTGHFRLSKRLPVAAGIGGGSADAAAALRLLARANGIALDDPRLMQAAAATGADVPVCLASVPRMMAGIGEVLSAPLPIPALPAVLVNPRVAVPTKDVFRALRLSALGADAASTPPLDAAALLAWLARQPNDLEAPALGLQPVIAAVLAALRELPGCRLARMSGSGATCFGLFDNATAAGVAARSLRRAHGGWWVRPTVLGAAAPC